jgi:hypothetical protein
MSSTTSRIFRSLAPALVVGAIAAPNASAMPAPDAPAAAPAVQAGYVDLRSPDARDVGRTFVLPPEPIQIVDRTTDGGFQWGDAALGAAGMLTLTLLGLGLVGLAGQRRRTGRAAAAAH